MIKFDNVNKVYPNGLHALKNINLEIQQGEFVAIIGLSGAGKSTLLRTVNRMHDITDGVLTVNGQEVNNLKGKELRKFRRGIGMVFQSFNLVTRTSVIKNVLTSRVPDMPLWKSIIGLYSKEDKVVALEALDKVGILDKAYVRADQLSGGQQQRVAITRALVQSPKILLLDEPLSNLDANLRRSMREKIRELQQSLGITSLYVTHDQTEAFAVSDEVIVMNKGKIMQKAPAKELYLRPNSLFLANFMGESSIFEAKLENNTIDVNSYKLPLSNAAQFNLPDGECLVGVRPEAIYLKAEGEAAQQCEIKSAVYMGNHWEVVAIWAGKELLINTKPEDFNAELKQAYVNFSEQGIFLLKKEK